MHMHTLVENSISVTEFSAVIWPQFIFSTALDGKIKAWLYDNIGSRVDYEAPGRWCTTMSYSADGTRLGCNWIFVFSCKNHQLFQFKVIRTGY